MPIVSFPIGQRRFAPSWPMTLLTVALCLVFVRLGHWQWDRGVHRQAEWDAFARGADAPLPLGDAGPGFAGAFPAHRRGGRWDAAHQFLLDNRSHGGLPGYEVLTPLQLTDGRVLLVDRGWVPVHRLARPAAGHRAGGRRDRVALTGRLDNLPVGGLALGHAAPAADALWPKVTSFPTFAELAAALAHPVAPWMLQLDPASVDGYVRDWQPPGLPPLRHFSYAIQWWGFAVTLLVIWGIMSARRQEPKQASMSSVIDPELHRRNFRTVFALAGLFLLPLLLSFWLYYGLHWRPPGDEQPRRAHRAGAAARGTAAVPPAPQSHSSRATGRWCTWATAAAMRTATTPCSSCARRGCRSTTR